MKEISGYFEGDRRSRILLSDAGTYMVEMYQNKELIEFRKFPGRTLRYAEDCAEDWVNGEIQ
jgi:hypothetical protein